MTGVHLVIVDGVDVHQEIQIAVVTAFIGVTWLMCKAYTTRAILRKIPKKGIHEVVYRRREAHGNEERLQTLADEPVVWGDLEGVNTIERFLTGLMSSVAFPKGYKNEFERRTGWADQVGPQAEKKSRGSILRGDSLLCQVGGRS